MRVRYYNPVLDDVIVTSLTFASVTAAYRFAADHDGEVIWCRA